MILYDLLTLLKDTVILDLFSKNAQKMITSLVTSKRQWCPIFHMHKNFEVSVLFRRNHYFDVFTIKKIAVWLKWDTIYETPCIHVYGELRQKVGDKV